MTKISIDNKAKDIVKKKHTRKLILFHIFYRKSNSEIL